MVWGAIAYDSRSTLIVMRGTLTGQHYVDDILQPHVGPFLNGLPGAIFQQDNARPHTARVAQDFLRHFQTLPWPARSPDLSLVEHVWDQLKRQIPSCHSAHDLELAVQDLCAHLPQDNIRCLINSMPDRVAACIAAGGGIVVSDADCGAVGLGSNPREDMDVYKCVVPLWHGGTLNSRRAASPLLWLVEGEEKWEAPGPRVFSL
ncbi:transposable element Tcb2 transposase [Trichonephila clavipes]|nr:transposable element Tcb2 transposase [Trichonephila clavipes]